MEIIPTESSFKQYLAFWGGQTFSLLGSIVVQFVLMWYLTISYPKNPLVLSLASFFYFLPMIFAMPIAGVFSDRWNRKNLIIIVDSSQAFATFILIMLLSMGITDLWIIFSLTMVPKENLSRINGINFLASGVVQLIGPVLAAFFLVFMTPFQALWIDVITFFIAFIPLIFIKIPKVRTEAEKKKKESFSVEFKDGFKTLRMVPGMIVLLIMSMLLNFLIQPLSTLMSYFAYNIHNATVLEYAIMSTGFQGGIIFGAVLTAIKKEWKHKIKLTFIVLGVFMVGYAMLAYSPYRAFIFMIITAFVMGFVLPIVNTIYQTIMQKAVPHDKLGRVSSIDSTLSMLITPLGALIIGPLALVLGVPNLFFFSALLGMVTLAALYAFTEIRHVNYDEIILAEEMSDISVEIKEVLEQIE
ncbi:MAG: MFS transporter [Promethearchaeota archaeon]